MSETSEGVETTRWQPGTKVRLVTEHFVLQSLRPEDIDENYVSWWQDPVVMRGLSTKLVRATLQQHRQRVAKQFDDRNNFHWGVFDRAKGRLIGFVTIFFNPRHGVALMNTVIGDRSYWGKTILMELKDAGMPFIFEELGAEKITGQAMARNHATVFINKAMGLEVEGVLRKEWRMEDGTRADVLSFGLLRDDWRKRIAEHSGNTGDETA